MKQLFLLLTLCITLTGQAQTPGWTSVQTVSELNGVMDVATDPSGNYYITGRFYNSLTLGNTELTAPGLCLYVAKCKPSGDIIQVTKLSGSSDVIPFSLAVDASGETYVIGNFRGTLTAGSGQQLTSRTQQDGQPDQDVFVLKCGRNGAVQWLRQISSTRPYYYYYSSNGGRSIAVDKAGNSYVAGTVSGTTVQFDAQTTFSDRYSQAFLASYSAKGELRWARVFEGLIPQDTRFVPGSMSSGGAVAVDEHGNAYLSGTTYDGWRLDGVTVRQPDYSSNLYLARFDTKKGRLLWGTTVPGIGSGRSLALAGKEEVYLADSFYGTVRFGSSTLTSQGNTDVYLARYDEKGRALSAVSVGTPTSDYPGGLAADASSGKVFLTGVLNLVSDNPSTSQAFLSELQPKSRTLKTELVGGPGTSSGGELALDKHNNIYTAGIFTGNCQFGSISVYSPFTSGYLARYGRANGPSKHSLAADLSASLIIFPNPAQDYFIVQLPTDAAAVGARATLYDSFGRVVAEPKALAGSKNAEARFTTSGLPKGLYMLRLEHNQGVIHRTIKVE